MKLIVTAASLMMVSSASFSVPELLRKSHPESKHQYSFNTSQTVNNRPMIGVLTQPLTEAFKADPRFRGKTSYIMASYINILESAGARTVPLIFDAN